VNADDPLAWARKALAQARQILDMGMPEIAARQAYTASARASVALIQHSGLDAPKTHNGIKSMMHDLLRQGVGLDRSALDILEHGYGFKFSADYGDPEEVSDAEARDAIRLAAELIEEIERILSGSS
jgi:uncharacterized protein (UPF0332 family)